MNVNGHEIDPWLLLLAAFVGGYGALHVSGAVQAYLIKRQDEATGPPWQHFFFLLIVGTLLLLAGLQVLDLSID